MTELPLRLRQVRDVFLKQALALSPERTYLHQPERMDVVGWMVAKDGIEPPTHGFSVRCSTN